MSVWWNMVFFRHTPPDSLPDDLRLAGLAVIIRIWTGNFRRDRSNLPVVPQFLYTRKAQFAHANVRQLSLRHGLGSVPISEVVLGGSISVAKAGESGRRASVCAYHAGFEGGHERFEVGYAGSDEGYGLNHRGEEDDSPEIKSQVL